MPTIHLEGNTVAADTQIMAILSGPLDKAQVSLRSNPPLPLSSIMSRLLFGSDVAELTGFQALELANSLSELSGSSPGVMESTRRALGVDRLRIYSTDSQDGERVSLEVGKYV